MRYTIKTDADHGNYTAHSFDAAAQLHGAADANALLSEAASVEGGWAWIECEDTGERIGGSTPAALAEWMAADMDEWEAARHAD